ncbi:TonB-dependent receptor [Candidatus Methylacidiphilum infernorum]|uniref:TonB-dependent receptor n=1 Tax=Candidatus Methylacidiphilum infernorum TaxID=511746 RepID=UPI00030ECD51|nr:TonB-dependent receptor [Candidatus Methylacidiphilum infernorum]
MGKFFIPFLFFCFVSLFLSPSFSQDWTQGDTQNFLQEDPSPPPVSTLPEVTVSASKLSEVFDTESSSCYGTPMPILDTPRAVSPISQTLMKTAGLGSWGKLDPLSFTYINPAAMVDPSQTGCASAPDIRGTTGLTFINGMEETVNMPLQDVPWNLNMVESIDLVEGPPGAVYGSTQPSNGYVNYITKQPYFDRFRGDVWDTTGMYDQYMWGADIGGPIKGTQGRLAYRFSYMGIESGSYYELIKDNQQNFYAALGYRPSTDYQADLYLDFGTYSYMLEDVLLNRPTEALIQNGLYYPGFLPPSEVNTGTVNNPPASGYLGTPIPISRRVNVKYPGDLGRAQTAMAQWIQRFQINDHLRVVNNTFFWYQSHVSSEDEFFFNEAWIGNYEIDNRTEVLLNFDTAGPIGPISHSLDTGLDSRYQYVLAYDSFNFVVPNGWSVFENPYLRNALFSQNFQALIGNPSGPGGGEWLVPSGPYPLYFEPLNGATGSNLSRYLRIAPFAQDRLQLSQNLFLILGARMNLYLVSAETPPGTPPLLFESLNTSQLAPLVNISPYWKPYPWMSFYFNFNLQQTTVVAGGGGYSPLFGASAFHLLNELEEIGAKFSLVENKLFFSGDLFSENTYLFNFGLPPTPVNIKGFEMSVQYQPFDRFWLKANTLFMNGVENWSGLPTGPPLAQTYSTATAFLLSLPLDNSGTFPPGKYALIAWPEQIFSGLVSYQFKKGIGISLGALLMSDMYLGYEHQERIPTQFILNGQLFYTAHRWEARLSLFNFTNEHYWLPNGFGFTQVRTLNLDTIFPGWPFWVEGTLLYRF